MIKNICILILSLGLAKNAIATETTTAENLSDILNGLNQKEVFVEGKLSKDRYEDRWMFYEANTNVYFSPTMVVRPANLRRLKDGCTERSISSTKWCTIKALAEIDTTERRISLIIFQILEAVIPE